PPSVPVPEVPPIEEPPAVLQPDRAALRPVIPLPAVPAARPASFSQEELQDSGSRRSRKTSYGKSSLPRDEGVFLPPVRASSTRVRTR
ncbi:MAG: hypothetical protein VB858_02675, partial [Planctomycetaceae bacterium]